MHEAIFENRFANLGNAFGLRRQRHELCLHIRREARVFFGRYVRRHHFFACPHPHFAVALALDLNSARPQFLDHRLQVSRLAIRQQQFAAGDRSGHQKCSSLDAVRNDGVRRPVQLVDSLHPQGRSANPFDFRAHLDQQFSQICNFRLHRRVLENRFALRQHCGGKNIFGPSHRDFRETERRAAQPLRASFHVAVLHFRLRSQRFQRLNMQIHGPRSNGAAAGQRNPRMTETRHQRAQRQHRRPHGFNQFVRSFLHRYVLCANREFARRQIGAAHHTAHMRQQLGHGNNVSDPRNILQRDRIAGQQRRRHGR